MNSKTLQAQIDTALKELYEAEKLMIAPTDPPTPMIRYRTFTWIHPDVTWPYSKNGNTAHGVFNNQGTPVHYLHSTVPTNGATALLVLCKGQPHKVANLILRIMSTTKWCLDRAEGRKRAAAEILKQQDAAVQLLEELAALHSIKKIGC